MNSPSKEAPILTQILGVSHHRDDRGNEGLTYALTPLGEVAPPSESVSIRWESLQMDIEAIRSQVEHLTHLAVVGHKRGEVGIEAAAGDLARHVLPEIGFVGMMGTSLHPQFDLIQDAASAIPWEVLDERYFICPDHHDILPPHQSLDAEPPRCRVCGRPMVRKGGKLALTYHLTHLVRGQGRPGGRR